MDSKPGKQVADISSRDGGNQKPDVDCVLGLTLLSSSSGNVLESDSDNWSSGCDASFRKIRPYSSGDIRIDFPLIFGIWFAGLLSRLRRYDDRPFPLETAFLSLPRASWTRLS